jgi:glycosyltransferase involved in cell wall biosynthesis
VVVAPLVTGTAGVKVKVAEAMSYGRPLVTTSLGVDGGDIGQLDGGAIVADDPDAFARGVIALLSDSQFRRKKSAGAARVFERHFSNDACYGEFSTWIDHTDRAPTKKANILATYSQLSGALAILQAVL